MAERERVSVQRIGMMLTGFLMLALIGVFATYAAPIPAMRGVIAETAIARAAASGDLAAIRAALAAAKPLLGRRGQQTLASLAPDRAGLGEAATVLSAETAEASRLVAYRLRLMVIVIGVVAGLFGVALLGIRDAKPTRTITTGPRP
ncbi:hypothetical protein [Acidiphilium iwatense]|uniref:Uncharacterized protein n=1 Tax=Acidiphilium iwatense TaxID=768198 RepID=A0ABS9DXI1_9PROT|nr:hypothetical protein [Acidiphilium iwatense]MCF3947453.1 hypothetical protein [Acidiphilium iwatense]